jgi:hypothetical protein
MIFSPTLFARSIGRRKIFINGLPYSLDNIPSRTIALDPQSRSSCAMDVIEPVSVAARVPVISQIRFGSSNVTYYRGYTTSRSYGVGRQVSRSLPCSDILFLLDAALPSAITFSGTPFATGVRDLMNTMGIPDEMIASIHSASLTLGSVSQITHEQGENAWGIFRALLDAGGCTARCLPASGRVQIIPRRSIPNDSPTIHYSNVDAGAYRWDSITETNSDNLPVSRFTCIGARIGEDNVRATWTATDVVGRSDEMRSDYWQTTSDCTTWAEFYGDMYCREERIFEVDAPLDPDVIPGVSILITSETLGLDEEPAYVVAVTTRDTTMTLTCSTGANVDGGTETYGDAEPPICDFSVFLVQELAKVGEEIEIVYDIILSDASTSPQAEIDWDNASTEWTIAGITPVLAPARTPESIAVIGDPDGVSVTLTVYDTNGLSCSQSKALDADDVQVFNRKLHYVQDGKHVVLIQSTRYPLTPSGTTATACARYNEVGPLWFGCENGDIYTRSQDDPTEDETLITNLSDSIKDIYVGEAFSDPDLINHVIASHSTSVSWTHDAGDSWQSYNFGAPTGIVAIDPFLPTHMFASSGTTMYETWDDGGTWTPLLSASSGTVGDFAAAPWDSAIVSSSGEVVFLSGNTWSASLSGTPQTITPKGTEAFVVATSDGSLYLFTKNGATYDVSAIGQTDASSGNTERIVRDGEHPIVFFADATGVGKQINDNPAAIYLIDETAASVRIGYAGLGVFEDIPAPPMPPIPPGMYTFLGEQRFDRYHMSACYPDYNNGQHLPPFQMETAEFDLEAEANQTVPAFKYNGETLWKVVSDSFKYHFFTFAWINQLGEKKYEVYSGRYNLSYYRPFPPPYPDGTPRPAHDLPTHYWICRERPKDRGMWLHIIKESED